MAVSIDLLLFYRALFERSCDAINALASVLHTHYSRRGFRVVNKNVSTPHFLYYYVHSNKIYRETSSTTLSVAVLGQLCSGTTSYRWKLNVVSKWLFKPATSVSRLQSSFSKVLCQAHSNVPCHSYPPHPLHALLSPQRQPPKPHTCLLPRFLSARPLLRPFKHNLSQAHVDRF